MAEKGFIYLDAWQFFATLANTLILFLILKKLLFKSVVDIIQRRQNEVSETYSAADLAKAEANELKKEYELRLKEAKNEANTIVAEASKRASIHGDEIIVEAKTKALALSREAEAEIERERKKAINEVKDEMSQIAFVLASKVLERDVKSEDHKDLVLEFIERLA